MALNGADVLADLIDGHPRYAEKSLARRDDARFRRVSSPISGPPYPGGVSAPDAET